MDERTPLAVTVQELQTSAEALAALGAWLRVAREGLQVDPMVATYLDRVRALIAPASAASDPQADAIAGIIQAFLRQAADLVEDPARIPGWTGADPCLVDAQGRASAVIPIVIKAITPDLSGLLERLSAPGARFLDVGTGVGMLAIAMAQAFPAVSVVGIDSWAGVLERARVNVKREGLGRRVHLRHGDIADWFDSTRFDAAWLPGPFLPREAVPTAIAGVARNLLPGGWAFFGLYRGPTPLACALGDLRAVRSGAYPWSPAEVVCLFEQAGFTDAHEIPRAWPYPLGVVVARHAPPPST